MACHAFSGDASLSLISCWRLQAARQQDSVVLCRAWGVFLVACHAFSGADQGLMWRLYRLPDDENRWSLLRLVSSCGRDVMHALPGDARFNFLLETADCLTSKLNGRC